MLICQETRAVREVVVYVARIRRNIVREASIVRPFASIDGRSQYSRPAYVWARVCVKCSATDPSIVMVCLIRH